jgi:hypothetical protein
VSVTAKKFYDIDTQSYDSEEESCSNELKQPDDFGNFSVLKKLFSSRKISRVQLESLEN